MAIQTYDAIVVGGGPAGSSCAARLVEAGLAVCVVDREVFPRQKLCAGWITPQVLQDLELNPGDYPHRFNTFPRIHAHISVLNRHLNVMLKSPQHSIRRYEFDDYLLKRSGARVEQHLVRSIRQDAEGFVVDEKFRAKYLIGAGGTRCPVYRTYFKTLSPRPKELQTTTLEQEFQYPWQDGLPAGKECHLWFFENGLPGYSWYVPKANGYLNCGLGAVSHLLKDSNQDIHRCWESFTSDLSEHKYVKQYSLKPKGYSYYLKHTASIVQLENVYIAGDAVGLATRDMGEGIGPAVISGQRVAESILTGRQYTVDDLPALSLPEMAGYGAVVSSLLKKALQLKLSVRPANAAFNSAELHQQNGGPAMQRNNPSSDEQWQVKNLDAEIQLSRNAVGQLEEQSPPERVSTTRLDRLLGGLIKRYIGDIHVYLQLWDGSILNPDLKDPIGSLKIQDRATLWHLVRSPEIGFAESYTRGSLVIEGNFLDVFKDLAVANRRAMPVRSWRRRCIEFFHRPRSNSLSNAKENIHNHYDLGNEFYASWLDDQMLYTCAYYPNPETSLAQAQIDKMDYICRKLELQPGQRVLETGCGWGALSIHMARHYGVQVKAFNISHEQIVFARNRAEKEGLTDLIEFIEDDYRQANGKFDAFVSVGMLEHVGLDHYAELSACIDRTLTADGRGLIHSIGRNLSEPNNPWIEKHIFPGSRPPSLAEMMTIFEPRGFSVLDVENLRLHYARTCHDWLHRYEAVSDKVEDMFDESFVRAWRLYLTGSTVAFLSGTLQLFQVVFSRADNNRIPWTRNHLYAPESTPGSVPVSVRLAAQVTPAERNG